MKKLRSKKPRAAGLQALSADALAGVAGGHHGQRHHRHRNRHADCAQGDPTQAQVLAPGASSAVQATYPGSMGSSMAGPQPVGSVGRFGSTQPVASVPGIGRRWR